MEFADKWLHCTECGKQFLWDAGEQAWYMLKRFNHAPKRCKRCRDQKRSAGQRLEKPEPALTGQP